MITSILIRSIHQLGQISPKGLPNPSFEGTLSGVFKIVMGILAVTSILFIAVGGLKYTLSAGDPQGIAKAKNTILYAIVGLVLAVSSLVIIGFVTGRLTQ